ncbi:hypothetical protein C8R46DRAFT_1271639 [Mycena filopes]|nr:hypothetical protein C8R46DRAFT_1271639 [Mycena filopes]
MTVRFWQLHLGCKATCAARVQNPSGGNANASTTTPRILLVSAFFPLSKSKHTMREYEDWLIRFLQPISTDIYFYAPPAMADLIRMCRGPNLPITIDTSYASPFEVPPLRGLEGQYAAMHALDRERGRHSPELYAVWNAKPFFLANAVRTLSSRADATDGYDFAFWTDAGSFREGSHAYRAWPDAGRTRAIWDEGSRLTGEKAEDLLFFPLAGVPDAARFRYWEQEQGPVDTEFSEGSFFGGAPTAIEWWERTFYVYHAHYLAHGLFVGKDQTLINALFLLFPERVITVWLDDPAAPQAARPSMGRGALGSCGPEWYYYQFWLARGSERRGMQRVWNAGWWWWRAQNECRVTGVLSMRELLGRVFGVDWEPPQHTLAVSGNSSGFWEIEG